MTRRTRPVLPLLALTLALLAAGLAGCNKGKGTPGAPAEGQKNAPAPAASSGQTPAQGQPGQLQGQAGQPGQPGTAASHAQGQPPFGQSPADAKPVDPAKLPAVVARINGQEIKKDDLVKECQGMRQTLAQMQGIQAPLNSAFYHQVLDNIVARTLLQQEAKSQGVTVSEAEVNQQMSAIRGRFPTPAAFKQALAGQGLTEEKLRQQMRTEGAVQKFVQTKVLANVTVSDQAARDFYDKNQDKMKQPERLHLRHILVHVAENAPATDKEKARAKAEELLKRAKGGEDFGKLASENSDDGGSKPQGGDLSWISRGQTVPPFEKAAFALTKPNEISPVTESQFGYHIIQLLERQEAKVAPFDAVKERIGEVLKQRQSQEVLQAHVQQLKTKAKVETFI